MVPATDAYKKHGLLPASERLERLRSVFRRMDNIEISTIDTNKPYFPHPFETVGEIVDSHPEYSHEDIVWVVGGDRLDWIANNDDFVGTVSRYRLIVFERPAYSKEKLLEHPLVERFAHRLTFLPYWQSLFPDYDETK